jgi:hypothetical protein
VPSGSNDEALRQFAFEARQDQPVSNRCTEAARNVRAYGPDESACQNVDSGETKLRYPHATIRYWRKNKPGTMDCEFIQAIETWGSGGQMMDVVVLKDGRILVIAEYRIALYENRAAFDSGESSKTVED